MKSIVYALVVFLMAAIMSSCNKKQAIKYPVTAKVDQTDEYFGTKVADPYRWLENDTSAETSAWVKEQQALTDSFLSAIPFRDKVKERLTKIWDYPKYGVPFKKGSKYFFFKNDGIQNQSVLYIQDDLAAEPKVFIDPNTFSEDGTIALSDIAISKDGKFAAYSIAKAGSDWNEVYVMEVETRNKLADELKWVKFSGISWKKEGFYYSRYPEPGKGMELSAKNENHKVYYHKVGTPQNQDVLVYENKEYPNRNYYAGTTEDESFLIISESESTYGNSLYVRKLDDKNATIIQVARGFDAEYSIVDNDGGNLLMITDRNAPRKKLVLVNPDQPEESNWKEILPEQEEVLQSVNLSGGKIVAEYMKDAASKAYVFSLDGKQLFELALPAIGTLSGFSAKKDEDLAFFGFTSFTFPSTVYKYDIAKNKAEVYYKSEIDFNVDDYETRQVFYTSKDGTRIPMFIVHKKGMKLDGSNPCYLYSYGGFNISLTPSFSISRLVLLENGFVFAMPNIRGGGEYGEEWHKAGIKLQKQNVFDDFIAAAEYLIKEKYTSSRKLAIGGGSNGGLLVGACMTQRPDLFQAALPMVGVMDMLRYHKFTIGWAWASDYGTSEDDSTMFKYLLGYSPLHNIKAGVKYPSTLVTTADHDDRVVPAHSFKFAATLQERHGGKNPVLIRIETRAGHGGGMPTSKIIAEYADMWSFLFKELGVEPKY
jgi:prolyl oligopeptidase